MGSVVNCARLFQLELADRFKALDYSFNGLCYEH